jgi:NAD+ synthase
MLNRSVLEIDCAAEVERICSWMVQTLGQQLHKRGTIIGLSGGIDSSVCGALAVRALGSKKVFGLLMPEDDSSSSSASRAMLLVNQWDINHRLEDIAPTLRAIGCYSWRDEAIRTLVPSYADDWKNKIVIAGGSEGALNHFRLVVQSPAGETSEMRLPIRQYLQIVAATNFKQRVRKTVEYFHADRLNYAVIGTPNRLEYDQGFFVKNGDGAADIKPIAHLYKTQVYALARYLGLPAEICNAAPTTDTYSLQQGQDEFYFALPYDKMDLALWAQNHGVAAAELGAALGLTAAQAQFVYSDIEAKRRATRYLHATPELVETIAEISSHQTEVVPQ